MRKLTINKNFPSKAFMVVIDDNVDREVQIIGSNAQILLPDFKEACRKAKKKTRKDGHYREVQLVQIILYERYTLEPEKCE